MPEKSSGTIKFPQVENLPYGLLEWNSRWFLELWANLLTSQLFTLGLILTIWWNFSVIQRCIKINKFGKTTLRLFLSHASDMLIFTSSTVIYQAATPIFLISHNFLSKLLIIVRMLWTYYTEFHQSERPLSPADIRLHNEYHITLLQVVSWIKKKTLTLTLTLSRNSFLHRFQNYLSRCCMQFHRFLGLQTSSWRVSWGKRSSHFSYKEVTQSEW